MVKHFGGIQALKGVNFQLRPGEVHALVGANGAGKSTLIKIITGAYQADPGCGEICFQGNPVQIHNPFQARELGISAVYQEFSLVNSLSVAENMLMGRLPRKFKGYIDWQKAEEQAHSILEQLETKINPRTMVKKLSVAQRQLVEIAKALSCDSKVFIMDEPTASLTENDIDNMFKVVKKLAAKGISIIYVSHRLEELPVIADRVTIFRDGQNVTTLNIEDAPKPVIIKHMVGKVLKHSAKSVRKSNEVLMEVEHFSSPGKFEDISFTLHKGEILGIAGLAGAGRTEVAKALFGSDPHCRGTVRINGKTVKISSPRKAKKHGLAFVTEDRKEEGLILNHSLLENITLPILSVITKNMIIRSAREKPLVENLLRQFSVKTAGPYQLAKNLSGGNQQKIVIAKWIATKPHILIMDEPTRGIDVGSKGQIYSLLNSFAEEGLGILMISSEIPEILEMSDRILVMSDGQITAEMSHDEASQDKILHYATEKTIG
ncbi:MAG: sugar ABC transporter ATP-binding protein [Proteiniphilum sp.]|nr:sugar ABC transporter ATP-binding protein [Proteiniphilum sp.]